MKFVYPAIISKLEEHKYEATFPDLTGCVAQAETLEETVDAANAAMYDWLFLELTEEGNLPAITDLNDLKKALSSNQEARNICCNVVLTDGYDE